MLARDEAQRRQLTLTGYAAFYISLSCEHVFPLVITCCMCSQYWPEILASFRNSVKYPFTQRYYSDNVVFGFTRGVSSSSVVKLR